MKCPICRKEMEYKYDMMESYLMEEYYTCKVVGEGCGRYSYGFVTGSTITRIDGVEIHGHYADSKEKQEALLEIENLALKLARQEWEKRYQLLSGVNSTN